MTKGQALMILKDGFIAVEHGTHSADVYDLMEQVAELTGETVDYIYDNVTVRYTDK